MDQKPYLPIEEMELFKGYIAIADWAWAVVGNWSPFARDTLGRQLVRAIDSVGANLVEGDGRYSDAEAAHFFVIARASARETRYWLQRSMTRNLIAPDEGSKQIDALNSSTRKLNRLIRYRRSGRANRSCVAETRAVYEADLPGTGPELDESDPFTIV